MLASPGGESVGPEVSRCGDHLQALIGVVISFQEAAIQELMCGPGKQTKHSWQWLWRGRLSGEKTELTAIRMRRDMTKYGTSSLVRPATLELYGCARNAVTQTEYCSLLDNR